MNKDLIRAKLKQIRQDLSADQIAAYSHRIFLQLASLKEFRSARIIGAYSPLPGEVNIISSLLNEAGKKIYLPVIEANQALNFYYHAKNTGLQKNKYQILEPDPKSSSAIPPEDLDLILIPMLGFDLHGNRLGMGQGYYDRYLAHINTGKKCGLAFYCQMWPAIPHQPHDIKMDIILTEKHLFRFEDKL
jgi:5-formyltetrahydrofolate cyclo-ligase